MNLNKENKLNGKDLINIGIYSAIYCVLVFVAAMLGCIPIFMPLLSVIIPLFGGIPYMLFLTKVKKFGMILIMTILIGIMMLLTGMGYFPLLIGFFAGLGAELVYKSGKYQNLFKGIISHGVFSIWVLGNYVLLCLNPDSYFATRQNLGEEYINALKGYTPMWIFPVLLVVCMVFGIVGGYLGKALLKKHFRKAGIA